MFLPKINGLPHLWIFLQVEKKCPRKNLQEFTVKVRHQTISARNFKKINQLGPPIGFVLDSHAEPAGKTRYYASSCVNYEGTFCAGRVSLNADRGRGLDSLTSVPLNKFWLQSRVSPPVAARNSRT